MAYESKDVSQEWREYWALPESDDTIRNVHLMVLRSLRAEAKKLQDPLLVYLYDMTISRTYENVELDTVLPAKTN
ncbi:hypothetical protein [Pyruvatibacter sp.]|uniref:hypothetical protein n=1 Tax=Pyruvatibacter sp. TaxID=1981328 RepID=UPI003263607F